MISENLHRSDLTALERDEQVARWIELVDGVSSQLGTKQKTGRPESGINAASRELGVKKSSAHRAVKVASIFSENTSLTNLLRWLTVQI